MVQSLPAVFVCWDVLVDVVTASAQQLCSRELSRPFSTRVFQESDERDLLQSALEVTFQDTSYTKYFDRVLEEVFEDRFSDNCQIVSSGYLKSDLEESS